MIVVPRGSASETLQTVVALNKDISLKDRNSSLDFDTLEQSVKSCPPIVVVEGSGKAADCILIA
jgi:hypothetical protein